MRNDQPLRGLPAGGNREKGMKDFCSEESCLLKFSPKSSAVRLDQRGWPVSLPHKAAEEKGCKKRTIDERSRRCKKEEERKHNYRAPVNTGEVAQESPAGLGQKD